MADNSIPLNQTGFKYDRSNPVIYDNDCHSDVFTDELLLALASAGEIHLRGFITTTTVNPAVNLETYQLDFTCREEIINKAARSGMKNIPKHLAGPSLQLKKPESGRIEDTIPQDTPGSRLVVKEALKATPEKPLVLLMGGPLTVAADAWLLDNTISDRVIVAWLGGNLDDMFDYNSWADMWSAYIVLVKMKLVEFPGGLSAPLVPHTRLSELPECELRQWMMDKRLPHVNPMPEGLTRDDDAQPVIALLNEDYATGCRRVAFSHWGKEPGGTAVPVYKGDPMGNALIVYGSNPEIATEEWWRAMKNPDAWGSGPRTFAREQRPFYAAPFPIGRISRFEAEDFDHGGENTAYHKNTAIKELNKYRHSYVKIIPAEDVPGGYNQGANGGFAVADLTSGEWLEYSVNILEPGIYDVGIRVSANAKGCIRIKFDGLDKTGPVIIPRTDTEIRWETVYVRNVELTAGQQVMGIFVEEYLDKDFKFNINYFTFMKNKR